MIELKNVNKTYRNGVRALDGISLFIAKGEMVYLTGKSGSGKSTLLKLLYKEEKANQGLVRVNNRNISKLNQKDTYKLRREIGVVFQNFKLLPTLTVYENIAYVLEALEIPTDEIEERVVDVLQTVGLIHKRWDYPADCSGGEQQRVAIARAICNNPKLLIADEPTGNLNPEYAEEIMRLFYRINKKGTTILIATHNMGLIEKFPNRVLEMSKGKLLSDRSKNHVSILLSEDFNDRLGEMIIG